MAKAAPTTKDSVVLLRIDTKLKARIVKVAKKDCRTLSGYIRHVLEKSLEIT